MGIPLSQMRLHGSPQAYLWTRCPRELSCWHTASPGQQISCMVQYSPLGVGNQENRTQTLIENGKTKSRLG